MGARHVVGISPCHPPGYFSLTTRYLVVGDMSVKKKKRNTR